MTEPFSERDKLISTLAYMQGRIAEMERTKETMQALSSVIQKMIESKPKERRKR